MTDLLSVLHEEFEGKYDFLRLGDVRFVLEEKKAFINFLVPEDVFDYKLNKEDVAAVNAVVKKAVGREYSVICRYEKIVLSAESVRSDLIEYMSKYFPLIAANIDFSLVAIEVGDKLSLTFSVPQNILDYMDVVSFESKLITHFKEKYVITASLSFVVAERDASLVEGSAPVRVGRYGKSVEVTDKALVCGKLGDLNRAAVHISTLKGEGEDVICCGKISFLNFRKRDESKRVENKRFFPHYYTFSINDTTGRLNVFLNTDVEYPALTEGAEVICKGRVNAREDSGSLGMYAKSVATCKIPFDVIAEQTKPLDPPEHYTVLTPQEYHEQQYDQLGFDLFGEEKPQKNVTAEPGIVIVLRSMKNERNLVPYEIALCEIEEGKIARYMHSYFKVAFTTGTEKASEINQKGYTAPRLSTVIPDLIKFTAGKLLIGINPSAAIEQLNLIAAPLRYRFRNDIHVIPQASINAEKIKKGTALDEAVELAQVYLSLV